MSADIDPVKYGVLWQKVQDLDKKVDKLEAAAKKPGKMGQRARLAKTLRGFD